MSLVRGSGLLGPFGSGLIRFALSVIRLKPGHDASNSMRNDSFGNGFRAAPLMSVDSRNIPFSLRDLDCQSDSGPEISEGSRSMQSGITRANPRRFASAPDSNMSHGAC